MADADLALARSSVIFAEQDKQNELCENFDDIKRRYNLSDEEILSLVRQWCSYDVFEAYEEWIAESDY